MTYVALKVYYSTSQHITYNVMPTIIYCIIQLHITIILYVVKYTKSFTHGPICNGGLTLAMTDSILHGIHIHVPRSIVWNRQLMASCRGTWIL